MLSSKEDLYIRASQAYADGEPIMSDFDFDQLEKELIAEGSKYVNYVSEDFNQTTQGDVVADYETFSIYSVDNESDAEKWFRDNPDAEYVAALKFDGICDKMVVTPHELIGQSRNRMGRNSLDYSVATNAVISKPHTDVTYTVTGEAFVPWENINILREAYDKSKYVTPRSAAISLLRTPEIHREHINLLSIVAFATSNTLGTYAEELEWLKSQGFCIPKYHVFKIDWSMDFKTQIESIMNMVDSGEPSDGVVVQVNRRDQDAMATGKYLNTQLALKFGKWGGEIYEAIVAGVSLTRARGNKGCVIEIEPLTLPGGSKQTSVNAHNPGILQMLNIKKGSKIRFRHVSNNMANLVY